MMYDIQMGALPKIAIVHNILTPYKVSLFSELSNRYANLDVIFLAYSDENREWKIESSELGFNATILNSGNLCDYGSVRVSRQVWQELTRLNPEVVIIIGYDHMAYWAAAVWAKRYFRSLGLWFSNVRAIKPTGRIKEYLKRKLVQSCDFAQVYSSRSKSYLASLGLEESKIDIVGNGSDNRFFKTQAQKWRLRRGELVRKWGLRSRNFMFIGRFSAEKNVLMLLSAFQKLRHLHDWGVVMVGDGPLRAMLKDYIKIHRIDGVYFPGFIQKDALGPYFAVSDVLVLPSISEPWGLVVNEAMASGLVPVVSNVCGCVPDLVNDKSGLVFDPNDPDDLVNQMTKAAQLSDHHTTDGTLELNQVDQFSFEMIADRIAEGWR